MVSDLQERISERNIVCLAGGVGGAKLVDGLAQIVPAEQLTVIVNTGDDFSHLGLTICPDLDTVMYTLGGVANRQTGWGRERETWVTFEEVQRLGGPGWFSLGDLDLATHLMRAERLSTGESLTAVTRHLCVSFDISTKVLPMSDQSAPTLIATDQGVLPFQTWFVKEQWQPAVCEVRLPEDVRATPQVMHALEYADYVLIAPSNPFVSVDPILNVYPIREMVMDIPRAVVAVTPIVGGKALKGPAAKMMGEMGMPVSATSVAAHYGDLLDGFVYDEQDDGEMGDADCALLACNTIMREREDRVRLAADVLGFATDI